jgi:7-cyano-7-deazaguanosine (preQ0) biosynthesis protein QueE
VTHTLVVNELFGPTIQGEGPSTGRRCGFVRLGRCNQSCAWCDEPQTWAWDRFDPAAELHEIPVDDVLAQLDAMDVDMVVVTGGEPLLQQRRLEELLGAMKGRGWRVEIETAGTVAPTMRDALVDQWNVSPKLANSGNPLARRYKPDVLRAFEATGRAAFKFVVCEPSDLDEADAMVQECGLTDVWIMPEGTDAATLERRSAALADDVVKRGWNLSTRLHILLWGNRRGV